MKKVVVSVFLVALCLCYVFAAGNRVKASVSPFALQISTSSADGEEPVKSKYGFGFQAEYQFDLSDLLFNGLYAQAGVSLNSFSMPDDKPGFTSLLVFAGFGYNYEINEKNSCGIHFGVGEDNLFYNSSAAVTIAIKTGLDFNYALNEKLNLNASCECAVGFAKNTSTEYKNIRVVPAIGATYVF